MTEKHAGPDFKYLRERGYDPRPPQKKEILYKYKYIYIFETPGSHLIK